MGKDTYQSKETWVMIPIMDKIKFKPNTSWELKKKFYTVLLKGKNNRYIILNISIPYPQLQNMWNNI